MLDQAAAERRTWLLESLLGLAVGDALGAAHEGAPMRPQLASAPFYISRAVAHWTDDTQMALSVAEVLLAQGRIDQDLLARRFGERYEAFRGYARGMHRLLPVLRDGGDWRAHSRALFGTGSYGNGAAMRVAPLGAYLAHADVEVVAGEARLSAEVTHAHREGLAGAAAVALAAWLAVRSRRHAAPDMPASISSIVAHLDGDLDLVRGLLRAGGLAATTPLADAVDVLGNGSNVTCQDTVPLALWLALTHLDDYRGGVQSAIAAGGDADTLAAIVGGIVAARTGAAGIPADWRACVEPLPPELTLATARTPAT